MAIIDTHIHVWDLEKVSYGWLKGNTSILNRTYTIEELEPQLPAAGVTEGVLVQAENSLEETNHMLSIAKAKPWIKGVVGWVPLLDPDATQRACEQFQAEPLIKGFRHLIHDEPNTKWLLQERVIESLKIVAAHGYTYDVVGTKLDHLTCVRIISNEVPELKMVLDHLNQPPIPSRKLGEWSQMIEEVAKNPNLYAKISGLGLTANNPDWNADYLKPYVSFTLATFGADRCMLGGDWPVALLAGEYAYTMKQYQSIVHILLDRDKQKQVYQGTASNFYNL